MTNVSYLKGVLMKGWARKHPIVLVLATAAVMLAVGVPVGLAIHDFTDVPDASPFHGDIAAVKRAGITAGKTCVPPGTPPTYCPAEGITREAMAAFVHRGFGRVDGNIQGNFALTPSPIDVAVLTIEIGGVAGQTQFVKLNGQVGGFASSPTDVLYWIVQDGGGQLTANNGFSLAANGPSGLSINSGATTAVVAVASGTTQTFRLQAVEFAGTGAGFVWGEFSAVTAPFGATGTNTLGEATIAKASSAGVQKKK
jgi:hypothetical protein